MTLDPVDGLTLSDLVGHDHRSPPRRSDEARLELDGRGLDELLDAGWTRGDIRAERARARAQDDRTWREHMRAIGAVLPG